MRREACDVGLGLGSGFLPGHRLPSRRHHPDQGHVILATFRGLLGRWGRGGLRLSRRGWYFCWISASSLFWPIEAPSKGPILPELQGTGLCYCIWMCLSGCLCFGGSFRFHDEQDEGEKGSSGSGAGKR